MGILIYLCLLDAGSDLWDTVVHLRLLSGHTPSGVFQLEKSCCSTFASFSVADTDLGKVCSFRSLQFGTLNCYILEKVQGAQNHSLFWAVGCGFCEWSPVWFWQVWETQPSLCLTSEWTSSYTLQAASGRACSNYPIFSSCLQT